MKNILRALGLVAKYTPMLALLIIVITVLHSLAGPVNTFMTQLLIDRAVKGGSWATLAVPAVGSIICVFVFIMRNVAEKYLYTTMVHKLAADYHPVFSERLMNKEFRYFEDEDMNNTISRVGGYPSGKIKDTFMYAIYVFTGIINYAFYLVLFGKASALLFCLALFGVIAATLFSIYEAVINRRIHVEQTPTERRNGYLTGVMSGKNEAKELRIFGLGNHLLGTWADTADALIKERVKLRTRCFIMTAIKCVIHLGLISAVIWLLMAGVQNKTVTIGQAASLFGAMTIFSVGNWGYIPWSFARLKDSVNFWKDFYHVLELPEEKEGTQELPEKLYRGIEFDSVSFKYPGTDIQVLHNVSFCVRPGEKLAMVGPNGAGKSTIVKLLLGFYRPDSGTITVDGTDIFSFTRASRLKLLSGIMQGYGCYQTTLRENIAIGNIAKIDDDEGLLKGAKAAMLDEVIKKLPEGLDSKLGKIFEEGYELSGGEWQRVAIARAYLSDALFMVLDEPVAALDPLAEYEVYKSFSNILGDKGCILISHRMGSARIADRVVVVDEGTIKESGTHEQLMRSDTMYRRMFNAQAEWYQDKQKEELSCG